MGLRTLRNMGSDQLKASVSDNNAHMKTQVFTPYKLAKQMVDRLKIDPSKGDISILDNSCGTGNLLIPVVRKLIRQYKELGFSGSMISQILGNCVTGFEIDTRAAELCIDKLNQLMLTSGLKSIKWNIQIDDWLKRYLQNPSYSFDYIVSNPPYQAYNEMSNENRDFLRDFFETCHDGKFDYCFAFIESSIKALAPAGRMSVIFPSSLFKTVYAKNLRSLLLPLIESIEEHEGERLFPNALVSASVVVCDASNEKSAFKYKRAASHSTRIINKATLNNDKWVFNGRAPSSCRQANSTVFGDLFEVSMPVATLANRVFLLPEINKEGSYYCVGSYKIEQEIVRKAASPRMLRLHHEQKIIFPYLVQNGTVVRLSVHRFEKLYPQGAKYLRQFSGILGKRNVDHGCTIYEYGRSQAIKHLEENMLLLSSVVTGPISCYLLPSGTVPYAGILVRAKKPNMLNEAKRILTSHSFYLYSQNIGIKMQGNSKRISPKDILEYPLDVARDEIGGFTNGTA